MKISIMQPNFLPYSGYLRLLCATDLFVIYNCVQFPRRSWVHRNRLKTKSGALDYLTMPLQKQPMDTVIKDLLFRESAQDEWHDTLKRYSALSVIEQKYPVLYNTIRDLKLTPCDYIVNCLREICHILAIPFNITYSASLNIPANIKSQDRILHIASHFQATEYVNASGGRALYEENVFQQRGIKLRFLPDYNGEYHSIIQCLAEQEPTQIRDNLYSQL